MTTAIENISKDVRSITRANRNHLEYSDRVLKGVTDIRNVTMQNAVSAQSLAREATGLTDRARRLAELMVRVEGGNPGIPTNGNEVKGPRRKTKKAGG
jgi:methyl-accepting chemotaxis protein